VSSITAYFYLYLLYIVCGCLPVIGKLLYQTADMETTNVQGEY